MYISKQAIKVCRLMCVYFDLNSRTIESENVCYECSARLVFLLVLSSLAKNNVVLDKFRTLRKVVHASCTSLTLFNAPGPSPSLPSGAALC